MAALPTLTKGVKMIIYIPDDFILAKGLTQSEVYNMSAEAYSVLVTEYLNSIPVGRLCEE